MSKKKKGGKRMSANKMVEKLKREEEQSIANKGNLIM